MGPLVPWFGENKGKKEAGELAPKNLKALGLSAAPEATAVAAVPADGSRNGDIKLGVLTLGALKVKTRGLEKSGEVATAAAAHELISVVCAIGGVYRVV